MRYTLRSLLILSTFVLILRTSSAQQVNPSWQINWTNAWSCTTAGCPVQLAPTSSQTVTQPTNTSFNVNIFNRNYYVGGANGYGTVQAAVNAAGSTGNVVILPNYTGTDTWTFAANTWIRVIDLRPYATGGNQHYPGGIVQASEFGALCAGNSNDGPAINAAIQASIVIAAQAYDSAYPNVAPTVQVPQGLCITHEPILVQGFGSLQGAGNATTIQAAEPWTGDTNIIEVVNNYTGTSSLPNGLPVSAQTNRYVRNLNLQYLASTRAMTGIKVWNQTGSSATLPYPAGANPEAYQLPDVQLDHLSIFAMDQAIDLEDCNGCSVNYVLANFVRIGLEVNGNVFAQGINNVTFENGSYTYSSIKTGPSYGIVTQAETRYLCSNTSLNCSTGTSTLSQTVSPQGCGITGSDITTFDTDLYIANCQGASITNNGFDYGGDGAQGTGAANPTVKIAPSLYIQFDNNYFANAQAGANVIEVQAATFAPGDTSNRDGLWITNSQSIQNYAETGTVTGSGIYFDAPTSSTYVHRNVYIQNNNFQDLAYGIYLASPVTYSVIRGNYGAAIEDGLIDVFYAGSTSFQSTIIADNTTPDAVNAVLETSGGGYILGYNQSPAQLTGTQTVAVTGCSITAGAIGNFCNNTITISSAGGQPYPNASYTIVCSGNNGTGNWATGNPNTITGTSFVVPSIAQSTTATGGGSINCSLTHN
jgi:hypothetical protein